MSKNIDKLVASIWDAHEGAFYEVEPGEDWEDIWDGVIGDTDWVAFYAHSAALSWLAFQGEDPLADQAGMSATAYFSSKAELARLVTAIIDAGDEAYAIPGLHGET